MKSGIDREDLFFQAEDRYGASPEYLWARNPTCAVLRRGDNRKWFAVVMDVPPDKLGLPGGGVRTILNVKCDPRVLGSLLQSGGCLPAYHMNKERWVSVLLDGPMSRDEILAAMDASFALAAGR